MTEEWSATVGQLKGSTLRRSCSRQTASKGKQQHTCVLLTRHPRLPLTHSADLALMGWVFKCSLLQNHFTTQSLCSVDCEFAWKGKPPQAPALSVCLTYSFFRSNNKEFVWGDQSDFTASERKVYLSNREVDKNTQAVWSKCCGCSAILWGQHVWAPTFKKKQESVVTSQSLQLAATHTCLSCGAFYFRPSNESDQRWAEECGGGASLRGDDCLKVWYI